MARKTESAYTYHCTPELPYRGYGLREGTLILHSGGYLNMRNSRRYCKNCNTDLGLEWERSWEKEDRAERLRRATTTPLHPKKGKKEAPTEDSSGT